MDDQQPPTEPIAIAAPPVEPADSTPDPDPDPEPAAAEPQAKDPRPKKPADGYTRFINISTLGDLDIPGLGIIRAGDFVDVDQALAEQFTDQPDNWKKASK